MTTSAPSLCSAKLNELQEVEFGVNACSSSDRRISGMEEAESEYEPISEEMELNPMKPMSGQRHIEEMENVRSHLQTILRARATETHELLPSTIQNLQDESDATSHASDLLIGVEELFPRYSRLRADFGSAHFHTVSELQVIRESLERERARHKQAEQQLLAVQSKALVLQQQLAFAVSADRKKDIMIEQLDKTLEKVVEGWRRHEREKSEGVRRLQEEKEAAENTHQKHREALVRLENSLLQASETIDQEQKRNENLQNINKQLECDMVQLRECVSELEQEAERLCAELQEMKAETQRLQTHNVDLQQQLEQHTLQAKHTHTHLQQELTLLKQQLETEKETVRQEMQLHQEAQSRTQQLQQDIEETTRERDTARVDRALDQARFEAQRSQWEVERRLSLEQQVTERLAVIQEENANATAKLRENHRKQLLDLSARHEHEFSVQANEFRAQLKEKDYSQHQCTLEHNKKMAVLQEELVSVETSKRKLEAQREELVSRLQGMMRSHWAEALRLLTNQEQNEELMSSSSFQNHLFKPQTTPRTNDICGLAHTLSTAVPQAVVLQLCRERGMRGRGDSGGDGGQVESDFSLFNHSHTFSPLEPILDDTHLTGVSDGDLWDRPVRRERQTVDTVRKTGAGSVQSGVNSTPHSIHTTQLTQESYCDVNQHMIQSDEPKHTLDLLKPTQTHTSTNIWANQSAEKGAGQDDVSNHMYSSSAAPPTQDHKLSVKVRAPPLASTESSVCDERQNELQYYISKLLERSPGEPLYVHQVSKNRAEKQSAKSGVSSQEEFKLEQLADLLTYTLPSTHTAQQLDNFMRLGDVYSEPVRANLDHKLTQNSRKEQHQSASRPMQNMATRGRRVGPQGQRSGSKVNAWR